MAMHIQATWCKAVELEPMGGPLRYECPQIETIPHEAGAYILGRREGANMIPVYIGKSTDLRVRLRQYLRNAPQKRMTGLAKHPPGGRFFICCTVAPRVGQPLAGVLKVLENALMQHALANGYELMNIQGNRRKDHEIAFSGVKVPESVAAALIRLPV